MFRWLIFAALVMTSSVSFSQDIATPDQIYISGHEDGIGYLVNCEFKHEHCSLSTAMVGSGVLIVLNDDDLMITSWTDHHLQASTKTGSQSGTVFLNDKTIAIDIDSKTVTETLCGKGISEALRHVLPIDPYGASCYQTTWKPGPLRVR